MSKVLWVILSAALAQAQTQPSQPRQFSPSTPGLNASANAKDTNPDALRLLPNLPPLPRGKITLIGGTITSLDRVRDQLIVQPFGGGKLKILFDGRTRIYRGGSLVSPTSLRQGDRVYLDTMLDGTNIFAKTIRFQTSQRAGDITGQVVKYKADTNELIIRDALAPHPITLHLRSETRILNGTASVSPASLAGGTLVGVKFDSEGSQDVAREISILASAGTSFTFAGSLANLDLSQGWLAILNPADNTIYDVYFDPVRFQVDPNLHIGNSVIVKAAFDGSRYSAQSMTIIAR